jgi:ATP-binding cassette subfamily F protein 3
MILLRDLGFSRNGEALVTGATLQMHPGWKVGLTGANGCGKSSFLGLLRGELHADRGDLERPPGWVLAHVAQDTPALPDAALDFVLDGDTELRQIERDLARGGRPSRRPSRRRADRPAALAPLRNRRLRRAGARRGADARPGLFRRGFPAPVAEFSGGWRVRLNLARALMCRSDLLLLDEPTNHLDLDAIIWLEDWLKGYAGTLILISHDRDFLDVVTSHILAIEAGKMQLFTGNYSACERARAEAPGQRPGAGAKQKREAAHLQSYIDRFRAKASKARQAQSRIKMLAKMGDIVAAHIDTPFSFSFPEPSGFSDPLLLIDDAKVGYDKTVIFDKLRFTLRPDSRIGLLGRNGAGKSTLMKLLAGELQPLAGVREEGRNLKLGYFAQHQLEQLRPAESPLWHMIKLEPRTREQDLRNYLGGFDFPRRHGGCALRPLLRRRENAPGAGADDPHRTQPAAAGRADQPPRPRNARGADHRPAGDRGRHGAGLARPPSAARHLRRALAGGRRQGHALRRRPRRLCRLAQPVARRGEIRRARKEPAAPGRRSRRGAQGGESPAASRRWRHGGRCRRKARSSNSSSPPGRANSSCWKPGSPTRRFTPTPTAACWTT